jgi:PBSX family phage terminase large subunit
MTGKTERTLQRNILDPIVDMIGSKRFKVKKGSGEAEFYGRKIYLAGANDERAQEKIRGVSLAGAYGDEITLWPESFFKMLLSRLRIKGARLFGTTNPDSPYHWLKTEYLDREGDIDLRRFQFGIDDNITLDPGYVASIKNEYTGLWYKRFILGLWCQAEGAIYDMWDEEKHVLPQSTIPEQFDRVFASCDYGTTNPFAAGLYGILGPKLYKIKEYHYDSHKAQRQKTDKEYADDMIPFIGNSSIPLVIDPSAASFKVEMRKRGQRVIDAENDVLNGIRLVAKLFSTERFFISEVCAETRKEIPNYVWDKRAQVRGEDAPLKQNDHHCDEGRYACAYAFGFNKTETHVGSFRRGIR